MMELVFLLLIALCYGSVRNGTVEFHNGVPVFVPGVWNTKSGYALAKYDTDTIHTQGWAKLYVETNRFRSNLDDAELAVAAGFAEGFLTANEIYKTIVNNGQPFNVSSQITLFVKHNLLWMQLQIVQHANDPYWMQIHNMLSQMVGMRDGYNAAKPAAAPALNLEDILILSGSSSIGDLETGLKAQKRGARGIERNFERLASHCSGMVALASSGELFTAHDTWTDFFQMLRILKTYNFDFLAGPTHRVKGRQIKFSSYPGYIWSSDDFYTIGSHLSVFETTADVVNTTLWQALTPESVFTFFRAMAANRLATSAKEWTDLFAKFNSGTYNNQWIAVDYERFRTMGGGPKAVPSETVMMLEQLPGFIKTGDISQLIQRDGYFGSFNLWYFPETVTRSGSDALVKKFGAWFAYATAPRFKMFLRAAPHIHTLADVQTLMRWNAFHTDPLADEPVRSGENAISARSDLNAPGSYPFPALGPRCHGGIDSKVTSSSMMAGESFVAVAGPTFGGQDSLPKFQWSKTAGGPCAGKPHEGIPDIMAFDWMKYE